MAWARTRGVGSGGSGGATMLDSSNPMRSQARAACSFPVR